MGIGDRLKWRGIRPTDPEEIFTYREPPEGCTYLTRTLVAVGANVTIYTVPANYIFYLTDYIFSLRATGVGNGNMRVNNGAGTDQFRLADSGAPGNWGLITSHSFATAVTMVAEWYISLYSSAAAITCYGSIAGYTRAV